MAILSCLASKRLQSATALIKLGLDDVKSKSYSIWINASNPLPPNKSESGELAKVAEAAFLDTLLNTKPPQIFEGSAVAGDGSDWDLTELGVLGDVSIAVPVTILTTDITPLLCRILSPSKAH